MKYRSITLAGFMVAVWMTAAAQDIAARSTTEPGPPSVSAAPAAGGPTLQERNPRYHLRRGDSFDLDFGLTPEFNQTVAVQPDGYVALKGVGSLYVEGKTVPELTESLKTAYAKILHDPVPRTR